MNRAPKASPARRVNRGRLAPRASKVSRARLGLGEIEVNPVRLACRGQLGLAEIEASKGLPAPQGPRVARSAFRRCSKWKSLSFARGMAVGLYV